MVLPLKNFLKGLLTLGLPFALSLVFPKVGPWDKTHSAAPQGTTHRLSIPFIYPEES